MHSSPSTNLRRRLRIRWTSILLVLIANSAHQFSSVLANNSNLASGVSSTTGRPGEDAEGVGGPVQVRTCCSFQSLFDENSTSCKTTVTGGANTTSTATAGEPFGPFFKLPRELLTYVYEESVGEDEDIRFRLKTGLPNCPKGSFSVTVPISSSNHGGGGGVSTERRGAHSAQSALDSDYVAFTPNGYLKIGLDYYAPNEYCIDSLTENKLSIGVCHPTCDETRPCITKCCDMGQVWDFSDTSTVPKCGSSGKKSWEPTLYSDRYTKMSPEARKTVTPHYIAYHPAHGWCDYGHPYMFPLKTVQDGNHGIVFRVLHDGSVVSRIRKRHWTYLPIGDYCLDGSMNLHGNHSGFGGEEEDSVILFCYKEVATSETTISQVYGVSMTISSLFLILTLVVFGLLWEKYKHNIQRWTIFCYISTLLFMYFFFILSYFSHHFDEDMLTNSGLCRTIGIGMHFFFLSTFCWLTTLNFEIWWTVRAINSPVGYFNGFKRLAAYALFGFGIPLFIVCIGLILEAIYDSDIESEVIIPEYGRFTCNIGSRDAFWAYMYGPVGFLLLSNMAFFSTTAYKMYQIQKKAKEESNFNNSDSKQTRKQLELLRLFGKLYLIMGIPWIFEVISFAAHEDEFKWYWLIFDLINIFQSIAIFMIFVCNRKTMVELELKYPILKRVFAKISLPKSMTNPGMNRKASNLDDSKLSSIEIGGIEDCGPIITAATTMPSTTTPPHIKETIEMKPPSVTQSQTHRQK